MNVDLGMNLGRVVQIAKAERLATFMQVNHVVKNEKTARNYVERLKAMGPKLDAVTAEMERQAKLGLILPVSLLDRSVAMIADTTAGPVDANPLVTSFVDRMKAVKDLPPALQAELLQRQ